MNDKPELDFPKDVGTAVPTSRVFIAVDLETTGLNLGENGICQIGAWATGETEQDFKDYFVSDCDPNYPDASGVQKCVRNDAEAFKVNGFTPERIAAAPHLYDVLRSFHFFLNKYRENAKVFIVGQNVPFDVAWLKHDFRRAGLEQGVFRRVLDNVSFGFDHYDDTLGQARLSQKLGIKNGSAHDALADAHVASLVFHALKRKQAGLRAPMFLPPPLPYTGSGLPDVVWGTPLVIPNGTPQPTYIDGHPYYPSQCETVSPLYAQREDETVPVSKTMCLAN